MYNQSNLAVVEQQEQALAFRFPDVSLSADFSQEELQDDTDGIRLTFPRAKIPGGGSILFELPGEDASKPKYEESIRGVRSAFPPALYSVPRAGWYGCPERSGRTDLRRRVLPAAVCHLF